MKNIHTWLHYGNMHTWDILCLFRNLDVKYKAERLQFQIHWKALEVTSFVLFIQLLLYMWHLWRCESTWLHVFSMAISQPDTFRVIIKRSSFRSPFVLSHSCGMKENVEWLLPCLFMTDGVVNSTNGMFSPSWPQNYFSTRIPWVRNSDRAQRERLVSAL